MRSAYGLDATGFDFVPSYDDRAATYRVSTEGPGWFLKVHFGPVSEAALEVPMQLTKGGISNILAAQRSASGSPTAAMGNASMVLYPLLAGLNAVASGLTDDQWRTFGATMGAIHDSGLERRFAARLPTDVFELRAAGLVEDILESHQVTVDSEAARDFSRLLDRRQAEIGEMVHRAEGLGELLRGRSFDRVLCHADIHAANIVVTDDDGIMLVDWDGPMIAPRERDLLFVIGSRIARDVEPHETARFFEGYGPTDVDSDAIVFYRYERVLEDIAAFTDTVLRDPLTSEESRANDTALVASFFEPGGIVESAEWVT